MGRLRAPRNITPGLNCGDSSCTKLGKSHGHSRSRGSSVLSDRLSCNVNRTLCTCQCAYLIHTNRFVRSGLKISYLHHDDKVPVLDLDNKDHVLNHGNRMLEKCSMHAEYFIE